MKLLMPAVAALALVSLQDARAAEVTLIGPGGIRAAATQIVTGFERASGHKVKATFGSGGGTKDRVIKGEPFDVPIVQLPLEPVIASGHVVPASQKTVATVAMGVAVRPGAPKPDLSNAEALKRMLLAAKSIAYPNVEGSPMGGGAGISFNETLAKLGLTEAMKPKIKPAANGAAAMAMVAKGEVEIGLTYISEIITEHGIDFVGPLPPDASTPTALVGFVSAHAKDPAAATALLNYLNGPEAAVVYKERGMQPGR